MENSQIIIVSVFSAAWLVLLILVVVLFTQVNTLRRRIAEMLATGPIRVQKATFDDNDKNHAFHNPTISPDEELSRRGYSMYVADDAESGRGTTERQTGGQFVEELARELDHRQHRHQHQQQHQQLQQQHNQQHQQHQTLKSDHQQQQHPPPFLLQIIEANKRKTGNSNDQSADQNKGTRQSGANSNFTY
ncbi:serum response factor homolog A-like [Hyposmocoma kahamanoa]|uniref:serum response factor homolog A-like n=1 Tax=Hyposmocoma kahamanoa TaxID=1477025 RepID=UPI000E6DA586|nr:serum response factor homolog A-like [Hyposmocoma kahamanoa]